LRRGWLSDGDGLVNLFEYVLDGHSPVSPEPGIKLTTAAGAPEYLEYAVAWRPGVDVRSCKVFLSATLGTGSWQEAVTRGTDIVVDRADPGRLIVRCRKTLPHAFLQLRAEPGGI
jgi:hypothetical protein